MRTDDLITLLAQQARPVPRQAALRRLARLTLPALVMSMAWMALGYGLRPQLLAGAVGIMDWAKILLPAAVAACAFVALERLGRPGVPAGRWLWGMGLPVVALWALGLATWLAAPSALRPALLWGSTWQVCVPNVALMAMPVFVASLWALRGLAPTRPRLAGAAAGAFSGGAGAAIYAMHCPELAAPFLAVWYVLGMAVPVALGAAVGGRVLRW
ncbi:NrsF family protein [Ramlibacter rhizophilus]|uniref:DUF1109 domain-containing protein n=1 Tax=Ramlibacter rhizophilus TaxID=1781167 RepID=A0A4Z0BX46_9BURK|nr:DUF1109 domain-containing protein [Ramlibacter rhizophilus]TFZ03272.1 DUF1109 domain-containing protein [Ramlibacter rhizophilus]